MFYHRVTIRGYIYINKRQIYEELLKVSAAMFLKYMKFTCPTNRKIIACITKEKSFRIGIKSNKEVLLLVPKLITVGEGIPTLMSVIGVFP